MNNNIKFTKNLLMNLDAKQNTTFYYDTMEKGLYLSVSPLGTKTFYIQKRIGRRVERIKIGRFSDMTIDNARRKVKIIKAQVAEGIDPLTEKRKIRNEATFQEMYNLWMEKYSKIAKKSWKYDEQDINNHCKKFFNRKISSITKMEWEDLFNKLTNECGKTCANRVLEKIRAMYNKMIYWGWNGTNPTTGIKKNKLHPRKRFLKKTEVGLFLETLKKYPLDFQDYVMLAIYSGLRKGNLSALEWNELDFENNLIAINASKSKNGEEMNIPMIPFAKELLLRRAKQFADKSLFVFPSTKGSNSGHIVDYSNYWDKFKVEAQLEDFHFHDLRKTLGSYQAINNGSLLTIQASLGHKSIQSTQVYAYLTQDPVQLSMENAVHTLLDTNKENENDRIRN